MARYNKIGKKRKLAKRGRQTRWAPFWVAAKKYAKGKRHHPSRFTVKKRSWRRSDLDI
jgi:ribosomal protein L39E